MMPEDARLLRLYVNSSKRWQGKSLYQAVVEEARAQGLAGASVFLADLAFGVTRRLRDAHSEYSFVDIPVVIEIVDAPEMVDAFLERLRPMVAGGFATVEPVRVVHYAEHRGERNVG